MMSSSYLTSEDMKAIERILGRVRPALIPGTDRQTAAARFLVERFPDDTESGLHNRVRAYLHDVDAHEVAFAQWNDDGGATGIAPRSEARRRIDNDTDGTRRRDRESAARNQLL
ncbi:hypothetical protein [Aquamicrobium soli]